MEEDKLRQAELESLGIKFLRFTDDDVKNNLGDVLKRIGEFIDGAILP